MIGDPIEAASADGKICAELVPSPVTHGGARHLQIRWAWVCSTRVGMKHSADFRAVSFWLLTGDADPRGDENIPWTSMLFRPRCSPGADPRGNELAEHQRVPMKRSGEFLAQRARTSGGPGAHEHPLLLPSLQGPEPAPWLRRRGLLHRHFHSRILRGSSILRSVPGWTRIATPSSHMRSLPLLIEAEHEP